MRRMWAAGAAIVLCLALGGLPVAGQESSEQPPAVTDEAASEAPAAMAPAVFTGEATCGVADTEEWITSDPRVTGPCSITPTSWGPDTVNIPGAVGDYTVNGPEGDWIGTWLMLNVADWEVGRNFMALEGTGAYEGWAVLAWAGTPDGWQEPDPWDLQGVIYEGSAPSLQWPEPPAE